MPEMYVMYRDGVPTGYAYGDSWVAQALFMDDWRYETEEEAIQAWERFTKQKEKIDG